MRRLFIGLLILVLAVAARAATPILEINGREFYGSLYTDSGELCGPLDVVGPLLLGSSFAIENYDVVLRKATFHYTPEGASAPVKASVSSCAKRGAAVYAPLKPLLKEVAGSYEATADTVRVAYPPAGTAVRPTAPTATVIPKVSVGAPLTPELALLEAQTANRDAMTGARAIKRVEVYHPVSPEPADAIPRTDVAGLKIYVAGLADRDQAWVAMWNSREPAGDALFRKHIKGFRGQDLVEGWFFVRLPLATEPGWHTVDIDLNHKDRVRYRFVTY
ncbi:MAG: hypothetical protein FJX76_03810 [Armatimonadetes bacterium]|nr:hypothetical protein [Armatimonadota bacterium]